jgi:phosphoglycerate-specific signal transduction histidine kinase
MDVHIIIERLRERNRELEEEIEKNREIIAALEDFAAGSITGDELLQELRRIAERHGDELASRIIEMLEVQK